MKVTKKYLRSHKDCYSDQKLQFLFNLREDIEEDDEFDVELLLECPMPLVDKFWFIARNSKLKRKEIGEILIGIGEIASIHYSEVSGDLEMDEFFQSIRSDLSGSKKLSGIVLTKRSRLSKRLTESKNDAKYGEIGLIAMIDAIRLLITNKKMISVLDECSQAIGNLSKSIVSRKDLQESMIKLLKDSI